MKKTLNMRRQLVIDLKYCYSARRVTKNMSVSRSLPTIALLQEQARNQLGTPGETKIFVRVSHIFELCSIVFWTMYKAFSRGDQKFCRGDSFAPLGYGPEQVWATNLARKQLWEGHV